MSLDSFIGFESDSPMSESAFEALRERMKAAAAQIAAIKKEEKKHKKKEEELIKILLKFIKNSHKKDLVLLISRVLEENIPANFVLTIILLGNEVVQEEVGSFLMLKGKEEEIQQLEDALKKTSSEENALTFFTGTDESLPLKIKIELDNWLKNLLFQAGETPQKLIKTAYKTEFLGEEEEEVVVSVKDILIQLVTFVLRDYMEQKGIEEPYEKLYGFAKFILNGILQKTKETLDSRKELN